MGRHDVKSTKRTREKTERKRLAELPLAPAAGEKNAPPASTGGSGTWPRRPRRSPGLNDIVPGKSMASDVPAQDISADPSPSGRGKLKWPVRPRPQRSARRPDLREGGGAERSEQISRRPRPAEEKTPDRAERVKGAEAKSVPFSKTEREKPRPAAPEPRENVSASRPEKSHTSSFCPGRWITKWSAQNICGTSIHPAEPNRRASCAPTVSIAQVISATRPPEYPSVTTAKLSTPVSAKRPCVRTDSISEPNSICATWAV